MSPEYFYIILVFVFLLGLVIGSFLNVVILRYNTGKSINGRSGCFSCGKKLEWYELIPVFSFIIQRGRCRKCGARLSWQYPLVELLTALLFTAIFIKYSAELLNPVTATLAGINILFFFVITALLIVILVYDIRHKIIPDGLVYGFALLSLLKILVVMREHLFTPETLYAILAGPLLFLPFFLLWYFSDGKWIGLGDGKLALGIGFLLGILPGISAIILSFWIGAGVSLLLIAARSLIAKFGKSFSITQNLTLKSEIPFAPFLIMGIAVVYFLNLSFPFF